MTYTFDYDVSYSPAMPVVEVEIKGMKEGPNRSLVAIVDSGADATIIPVEHLEEVSATLGSQVWLRGATHQRIAVDLYWIWLHIGEHAPMYLEVVGDAKGTEVILGRDVLNQLIVTLNGLAAVVEIRP